MIDPITLSAAVTGATTAYNAIKKAIMVGKEIEDMSSELGRWMTAVSDVDNVHKNANNPTTFDKIFNSDFWHVIANFSAHKHVRSEKDKISIEALIKNNVFGAPTFILENELFWGQDSLYFLKKKLENRND